MPQLDVSQLHLPRLYLVSPGLHGRGFDLVAAARAAFEAGARSLQIREPHLQDGALLTLVEAVVAEAHPFGAHLFVNAGKGAGMRVARRLKLGVHLDANWPVAGVRRELQGLVVGASAHSPMDVARAVAARADFVLLSPLLEARAGSAFPALGLETLQTLARKTPVPLFVMGGVGVEQVASVIDAGAYGIASRNQVFAPELEGHPSSEEAPSPLDPEQLALRVQQLLEVLPGV